MMKKFLLCAVLGLATVQAWAWKPIFVGHRGSGRGVENTEQAFRNGVDYYGYQGLECDVRVTHDKQYVISHDETTERVGGSLTVAAATLAELQAETYTQTRSGVTYTGKICTMAEYFDICNEKNVFPVIELKWSTGINSNDMSNFPGLANLIIEKNLADKVIILTSMKPSLEYVKKNYPQFKCQWLCNGWESSLEWCKTNGFDLSISVGNFDIYGVKKIVKAGLNAACWTVDTESNYKIYGAMGITMMTCNTLMAKNMPELEDIDWDKVVEPEDPIELKVDTLFMVSAAQGNLPANFPSGNSGTTAFTSAQMGWWHNGRFFAHNYSTSELVEITKEGVITKSDLAGTTKHGMCFDDAGNMILNASSVTAEPILLKVYPADSDTPVTIKMELNEPGTQNFITASGNIMSDEGGYVYYLPNGQTKVNVVYIVNGEFVETKSYDASISGTTASVVVPIDGDPANLFYHVRANGIYRIENGVDKGAILTGATTTAPSRNSSVTLATFKIAGHQLLLHGSGANYNGGFCIKDLSANKANVFTQPVIGSNGYYANPSCGAFYTVERKDNDHVYVYEYCMGNGIAGYEVYVGEPWVDPLTAVADVNTSKTVKAVKYYNLSGVASNEPFSGINIAVTTYTDGTTSATKLIK